jgi:hypothetical protein
MASFQLACEFNTSFARWKLMLRYSTNQTGNVTARIADTAKSIDRAIPAPSRARPPFHALAPQQVVGSCTALVLSMMMARKFAHFRPKEPVA